MRDAKQFLYRLPVIPQMISAKNCLHTSCRIMDIAQTAIDFQGGFVYIFRAFNDYCIKNSHFIIENKLII